MVLVETAKFSAGGDSYSDDSDRFYSLWLIQNCVNVEKVAANSNIDTVHTLLYVLFYMFYIIKYHLLILFIINLRGKIQIP